MSLARVDHGLDRERHSFFKHHAGACATVMQHLRLLMEHFPNTVTSILSHYRVVRRLRVLLYDLPDIAQTRSRFHQSESLV